MSPVASEEPAPSEIVPSRPPDQSSGSGTRPGTGPGTDRGYSPGRAWVALHAAPILVSAALLFLLQPMAAKLLLPKLGGSPAVWNTSMVVFQGLLLAGYTYAFVLSRWFSPRSQAWVHLLLIALGLMFVPIALPAGHDLGDRAPIPWLITTLLVFAGVPFLVVSTTGPLVQSWFGRGGTAAIDVATAGASGGTSAGAGAGAGAGGGEGEPVAPAAGARGRDPYFLYVASNAGSLVGLLAYPLLVEPTLSLRGQGAAWGVGYGIFAGLMTLLAIRSLRRREPREASGATTPGRVLSLGPAPAWSRRVLWVLLAAVPSSQMLGVTQFLSTDVAAAPLLWVGPLALYLISIMLAFASSCRWWVGLFSRMLPILLVGTLVAMMGDASKPLWILALLHGLTLLSGATAAHGLLASLRPPASRLTEFYLLMALGGVLGGSFNALAAPSIFNSVAEYPLALAALALLVFGLARSAAKSPREPTLGDTGGVASEGATLVERHERRNRVPRADATLPLMITVAAALGVVLLHYVGMLIAATHMDNDRTWRLALGVAPAALACFLLTRRLSRFGTALAALFVVAAAQSSTSGISRGSRLLHAERTFFGVYKVQARGSTHSLLHGSTLHGMQDLADARRHVPLTYYYPTGPIGQVFRHWVGSEPVSRRGEEFTLNPTAEGTYQEGTPPAPAWSRAFPPRIENARVAIVGLGCGSLAAYSQLGQAFFFHEIDELVVRLAQDSEKFTYLQDASADIEIVLGDGRLTMSRHAEQSLDLIVLDAFSSDAIPTHLLTKEAFETYFSRLRPGGLIAVHISNRYLDLEPVLMGVATSLAVEAFIQNDTHPTEADQTAGKNGSVWALLCRDRADLGPLAVDVRWLPPDASKTPRPWTDSHSSVVPLIAWW